ncbi:MAG: HAD-IIIA family hydrolase, partial [Clostridia bacterium]|nr:HAD-IIIA family hydrolase [Clostridia bacterium]
MGEICSDLPKPMVDLRGKPVLLRQIECLKENGISDFIIITRHLNEKIKDYFGNGASYGVNIEYYVEDTPLGTAGALFKIKPEEDFLHCSGDLLFNFSLKRMADFHRKSNALITLFTHPGTHPADSTVVLEGGDGTVKALYLKESEKPENYPNLCNAGIQLVSPEIFDELNIEGAADFDRDIVLPLVQTGRVYSYRSAEYVLDIGTPERLAKASEDLEKGFVRKYDSEKRKAVFLDRDGTINVLRDYIRNPDEIELIDGAAEAINRFHSLGYLVFVVTNQPVIARGQCSLETLSEIHNRLEMLLGEQGAYIDKIYFCPHHPKKGFEGEIPELKIECDCRKPAPG